MKIGSLFSGIGGIELGFEKVGGFETKWFVEKEPYCQAILKKHWPKVPIYKDITKVNFKEIEQVDIITGGFPCQDISNAGQRKGIGGERSGLWKEFWRAIGEIQPRYAFVENVSALTYRGLLTVLGDLAEIGYNAEWHCLAARQVGALHKRERIFIIAHPNNNGVLGQKRKEKQRWRMQTKPNDILIADHWGKRVQRFREKSLSGKQGLSWCKDVRRLEDLQGRQDIPEPLFRGGRDEVPCWMDRIKSIGNAVVPQCAEFFAEIIKEKEARK